MDLATKTPCPCIDCQQRCVGCHSKCEGYKSWRKELDEINAKIRAEKAGRTESYLMKLHWRNVRRKV